MNRTIAELSREMDRLTARLLELQGRIPLKSASSPAGFQPKVCTVISVNSLSPLPLTGVKYSITAPVSIPDYDVDANPSTVDGVGIAEDILDGAKYLFANYAYGTITPFATFLKYGDGITLGPTTTLPITASSPTAYKTLYIPVFLQS